MTCDRCDRYSRYGRFTHARALDVHNGRICHICHSQWPDLGALADRGYVRDRDPASNTAIFRGLAIRHV
jgi:hypothetical protein